VFPFLQASIQYIKNFYFAQKAVFELLSYKTFFNPNRSAYMPNMDYPGPCPNCLGIDSCSTDEQKMQSVKNYCNGLEMELNIWKARLYDVLVQAEALTATDQGKLGDTMSLIKSTVRELEMIKEQMLNECPSSLSNEEKSISNNLESLRTHYTKALEVISPGWFGG
jgi:hypothetical protein